MKYLLLILFLISTSALAFQFSGDAEQGYTLITDQHDYYAYWDNGELWAMWLWKNVFLNNDRLAECVIIRQGIDYRCTLEEFSIALSNFPEELK